MMVQEDPKTISASMLLSLLGTTTTTATAKETRKESLTEATTIVTRTGIKAKTIDMVMVEAVEVAIKEIETGLTSSLEVAMTTEAVLATDPSNLSFKPQFPNKKLRRSKWQSLQTSSNCRSRMLLPSTSILCLSVPEEKKKMLLKTV